MKRTAALGLVAVVFAVGLAAGVLGGRLIDPPNEVRSHRGPLPLHRYFKHGDLDLTEEQQRRLDEILSRQREKFDAVHQQVRPRVEELMDETQSEIEALLTPEQLERYRARRDRWHRRQRRHDGGRGGRHRHERRDDRRSLEAPPPPPPAADGDAGPDGI